jgi:predicted  nucleic acid-binding Zn-ribbon protein
MLADLDRLIRLQKFETFVDEARRTTAEHPQRIRALDARVAEATSALDAVKRRLADGQAARREIDKDLAVVQARLARYKNQLLEVKTNREYQAMQHEIAAAEAEVSRHEDRILEGMLEADELGRVVKQAEVELTCVTAEVRAERTTLDQEVQRLEVELDEAATARNALVAEINPAIVATFELVARGRKGVAVAEARNGLCTVCHVRLRPQVFNEVLRNDTIIQCDSCQRILYFTPTPPTRPVAPAAGGAS